MNLAKLRNIGISAHIDSGKTTLSERILYYTGRIYKIGEVHGGGDGATMDHMELEKERGITITSAATTVAWEGHTINLIDTPGHVDFTVEVERSLRVLDGAVLVLCAVGGVQSQSLTVDRQMKRYHIPRLAFINKMDRTGANPFKAVKEIRQKLAHDAILMQLPIGTGDKFEGVIDLVDMQAVYFDGEKGEKVRREAIPAAMLAEAQKARGEMLEGLAMYSDELMELLLSEEEVPLTMIHDVLKSAVQGLDVTPVYLGSAYKNKGVQLLLDAIVQYLPSPLDREINAKEWKEPDKKVKLEADPEKTLVAMTFKLVDDPFGQLTFTRVYQGTVKKGEMYYNQRTGRKERFSRIVRMHADKREEISEAGAGDIVAIMGIDAATGDTYAHAPQTCTLESLFVPEPVIKVAVSPARRADSDKMTKALQRFRKEDPTFRVFTDEETNEVIMAGMGELHLEIYAERIRREYGVDIEVGAPKVSYREAPTKEASFDYRHKKQSGGSGQFAHIVGSLGPIPEGSLPEGSEDTFVFEDSVTGGRIPKQYIPSVEKGFRNSLGKGPVAGYPVVGVRAHLTDGSYHEVDSSDMAFTICAEGCFRETFPKTKPILLEPVMKVEIECPSNFQGAVVGDVNSRRGMILATDMRDDGVTLIECEVPLAETFGYATDLRSMTQGQGTFSMEVAGYRRVPTHIQEDIVAERKAELVGAK
jgi:elongation factor G